MRFSLIFLVLFAPPPAWTQVISGTAFAVAPQMLVTNQHVVADCASIEIISADGRRAGEVVDADVRIDLALVRVTGLKSATATLRSPRHVRLGEPVMVFGFPLSGSLSSGGNFTSGIVSALRGLRDAAGELQITAPVQPGNSGGPLMDASGRVIGVVESKLDALRAVRATGDIPQNVNFAISLEVLADFLIKNNVALRSSSRGTRLDTARIAELAQSFTHRLECRVANRATVALPGPQKNSMRPDPPPVPSPSVSPRQLLPCQGPYSSETWNSCIGILSFPSGQQYVGEFKDGNYHGRGSVSLSNGNKYIGEFFNDKKHGQGAEYGPDGALLRSGRWADDTFVGLK